MNEELKALIEKNLPGMVGTQLKEVLTTGEVDRKMVVEQGRLIDALTRERDGLKRLAGMEDALNKGSQVQEAKRIELEKREAVLSVMEKNAIDRVNEMRGVVKDVFANSRLKYMETYSHPMPYNPAGGYSTAQGSRNVDQTQE